MKYLLILLIFVFSSLTFGQNIIATTDDGKRVILKPNKTWEYAVKEKPSSLSEITKGWVFITKTEDQQDGVSYYYQPGTIKSSSYRGKSTWLRIIPMYPVSYNKKYKFPAKTAFFQRFLTVDCDDERYTLESGAFYDDKGQLIPSRSPFPLELFQKAIPGSLGAGFVNFLCK